MNYYEHHIGDYAKDAGHLSMVEDGAYRRLIDAYYSREQPLPENLRDCCKLARATTKPERDAVAYVLCEFFDLRPDGHHQKRCDGEIDRFQAKSEKARRSANARWNAMQNDSEGNANAYANASPKAMRTHMPTHSEGNAPRARPQSPVTNNQAKAEELPPTAGSEPPNERPAIIDPESPPDPIFGIGLAFLRRKGVAEKPARSFLGLLRKEAGDLTCAELLAKAESDDVTEPLAWLRAAAKSRPKAASNPSHETPDFLVGAI